MFTATNTMALVFPCSLKPRPKIPLQRTKTFKPLPCLELKGGNGYGRMSGFHEIELQVRDYELDQFDVVNNAIYANYCQHGQHEFLKSMLINCDEVARSGEALAITELTIKFIAPLSLILEAEGTAVWLDNKYRPVRVPSQIRSNFGQVQFQNGVA